MCLTMPQQVMEIKTPYVKVKNKTGQTKKVLYPKKDLKKGQYVLIQSGAIVRILTDKQAKEAIEILSTYLKPSKKVFMHLPIDNRSELIEDISSQFPDDIVFTKSLETKLF